MGIYTSRKLLPILIALLVFGSACQPATPATAPTAILTDTASPAPANTATPTLDTGPATGSPAPDTSPTVEGSSTVTPTSAAPARPEEAIFIQEPGPGSQVTSPIRVAGVADPTFEQNLVVRIVTADGTEVAQVPTTIQADVGQRGPFEVEVPVDLDTQHNIFIQVYTTSARDGGITHLSSTGVMFSPTGPEQIVTQAPQPEQIAIFQPQTGETVSGGVAHVAGFALASFEQTLLIEILDADGNVVGSTPITVQAPDLGQPGPFSADVAYTVTESGPGRVVIRDVSPAFGGNTHLNSVEITLQP